MLDGVLASPRPADDEDAAVAAKVEAFLGELISVNPPDSIALFLNEAERHATGVDLGAKPRGTPIDFQAERSVLAVLLKHNGLAEDACAYAQHLSSQQADTSGRPSLERLPKPMLVVWRLAHSIKKWIMAEHDEASSSRAMAVATAAAGAMPPTPNSGVLGGSLSGGASFDVPQTPGTAVLARSVIEKAKFLLNFASASHVADVPEMTIDASADEVHIKWSEVQVALNNWKERRQHLAEPSLSLSEEIIAFVRDPVPLDGLVECIKVCLCLI